MTDTLTERINGRVRGRGVPELPLHTFKDSGITVRLHKLSPMTSEEIMAQCRRELADSEPQPPIVEVDYGQGKIKQAHKGDPVYAELLKDWGARVNKLANDRLFKLATLDAVELTIGEHERALIVRKKRFMKIAAHVEWEDDPDLTPEENERYFYVRHVACGSAEDIQEFYAAIATRSQPTEAAVEGYKETFPRDVSRPIDLEL